MSKKLSARHQAFVDEYVVDFNGTQAAIRVGYSEKTANRTAHKLLSNADIQKGIARALEKRNERVQVDQDYVLERLLEIDRMDIVDIFKDDCSLKPVKDWPPIWRQFVSGLEAREIFEGAGNEKEKIGLLKKIKWPDKVKNLEMIGKHVNVQAWKERSEVDVKTTVILSREDYLL